MNYDLKIANSSLIRCPSPCSWALTIESGGSLVASKSGVLHPILAGVFCGVWVGIWRGLAAIEKFGNAKSVTIKSCSMHVIGQFNRQFAVRRETIHIKPIAEASWEIVKRLGCRVEGVFCKKDRLGQVTDLSKSRFEEARMLMIDYTRGGAKDVSTKAKLEQIELLLQTSLPHGHTCLLQA